MSFDYSKAYRLMYLIRCTEEEIVNRYPKGDMRCPTHLSIGQEASAVGVAMALQLQDQVYCYHRCHAHYLAKGGNLPAMIAELYGKATGCTGGWGGSMHLADEAVRFTEASTAVGDCVSLAVGAALAFKLEGSDRTAIAVCGDSTVETGQFWEGVNFAALHRLPLMFVCENNLYSVSTPMSQRQPSSQIYERLKPFMWSQQVNDVDISAVHQAAKECKEAHPGFLEINTYRFREHVGPNFDWDQGYRAKEEVLDHMARDPLITIKNMLGEETVTCIEQRVKEQVQEAFEQAEAAPWPEAIKV